MHNQLILDVHGYLIPASSLHLNRSFNTCSADFLLTSFSPLCFVGHAALSAQRTRWRVPPRNCVQRSPVSLAAAAKCRPSSECGCRMELSLWKSGSGNDTMAESHQRDVRGHSVMTYRNEVSTHGHGYVISMGASKRSQALVRSSKEAAAKDGRSTAGRTGSVWQA